MQCNHNDKVSMGIVPLAPETSAQSLTASSSQSLTHLGHRYEKVIAVDSAKVHLGDVYGGTHTHIHQEAGEEVVTAA